MKVNLSPLTPSLGNTCMTIGLLIFALNSSMEAATSTYTGGGSDVNWSTELNWDALPTSGDDVIIADSTVQDNLAMDAAASVGSLTFGDSGTRTSFFTISGPERLTFLNGLIANGSFTSLGLNVTAPVTIGTAQTWSIGGSAGNARTDAGVQVSNATGGTQLALTLTGKLTKTGSGQLGFTGLNIGNGDIQVSGGSLKLNAANSTKLTVGGTGRITVDSGASLIFSQGAGPAASTFDINKAITLNGGSTLQLGGSAAVHAANSKITSVMTLGSTGTVTLDATKTSGATGTDTNFVLGGQWIGGTAADNVLEKTGSATVTFNNASASTSLALLKISEGGLILNSAANDGGWRGNVEVASGASLKSQRSDQINNGALLTINGSWDMSSTKDIIGALAGNGSVVNAGLTNATNGLSLNANVDSTFSGAFSGTYLATTGAFANTQTFTGTVSTTQLTVQTLAGTTGGIKFSGNAQATATGVMLGNAAIATDGTLTVTDNAKLTVGANGITQGAGNGIVALGGGTGTATLAAGSTATSTGNIRLTDGSTGSPVIDTAGFTMTLSGSIGGTGGFRKINTGRLVITGDNDYSGGTAVSEGELRAGSDTAFGTGSIAISETALLNLDGYTISNQITYSGGTLSNAANYAGTLVITDGSTFTTSGSFSGGIKANEGGRLNGTGTVNRFSIISAGGTLGVGDSPATLTFSNGLTLEGDSILDFYLGSTSSLIEVTGGSLDFVGAGVITLNITDAETVSEGTYTLFDVTGTNNILFPNTTFMVGNAPDDFFYSFGLNGSNIELTVTTIPEPATFGLMACAAALFWTLRRRWQS